MQAAPNLGFLAVLEENQGYVGGYLVTNSWGRPLEFRLTMPVRPNSVQQILYGCTLKAYVCADLIGKTLVEKAAVPVQLVVTDCEAALDLRCFVRTSVAWLPQTQGSPANSCHTKFGLLAYHPRFPEDRAVVRSVLERIEAIDLAEPFARIRDALAEARKIGVANRAA